MLTQWVSRVTTFHIMSKKGNQYSHAYEMTLRSASTNCIVKLLDIFSILIIFVMVFVGWGLIIEVPMDL